ncbi:MAG: hypothetical protein Q4B29_00945, partial [Candidatus Saccharibacteria bacterium]|nr:hypothetical protein [Candidatus Saccharibacteria bacterium]
KPKKEKTPEQKAKAEERKAKLFKALPWILGAILAIALILLLIFGLDWGGKPEGGSGNGGDENPAVETTWYGFYNPSLLNDETEDNNFDFGYNLADFEADLEAVDYDADLRERMSIDPKLGAAVIAWVDANVGTRYLGAFYDECKGEWASTMNLAAERWIDDEEGYKEKLKTFFAFLDTASVDLKNGKGIEDQMYMNPYTESGIPDIIVLRTDQDKGLFLAYTFKIKGNLKVVMYRTDCGYQPTNVEKVMNIKPQEKPKTSTTPTSNPSSEDPGPTKPTYKKDPTKGTQGDVVGPNDNPGPGPDTNNGKGATESKEQQPEASVNLPTYQEYEKVIDDLKDINETQKEGTGSEGINKPTQITKPATTTNGESVDSNGAGEAWGGPPDA